MMKATIRRMGNSQGVLIPQAIIAQLNIEDSLEMSVENNAIVLRKPEPPVRVGWAAASQKVAAAHDDGLAWPEFANQGDTELTW
jgi:antitoxin MazE